LRADLPARRQAQEARREGQGQRPEYRAHGRWTGACSGAPCWRRPRW
jgi:hypothetical protein